MTTRADETIIKVVGPTVLEADTLECIVSALSLIDAEAIEPLVLEPNDDATQHLSPSDQPPTISSLLTISW
jgi:hypothetical protein